MQELLCQIKDKRRKQGTRHSVSNILLTVILGTMSGYYGYRGLEDFCHRYKKEIALALGKPKHGIPSYSSIRRVIMDIDFNVLSGKFYQWIRPRVKIKRGEWMQIDGKGIGGTVQQYETRHQNFINLVSLFMNRTGLVLKVNMMENQKGSEINIVKQMIQELDLKGMIISMDALHCQKKRWPGSGNQKIITW